MKRSTASAVTYVVLLLILAALLPWGARSTAEFGPRAMLAVVVAVVLSLVTRYGLELFVARSTVAENRVFSGTGGFLALGLWRSVKFSCAVSLVIGIASIVAGTSHLLSATAAFFATVIGQQLTLMAAEIFVARQPSQNAKPVARVLALIILVALAAFFAWASNITFLAQRPPVSPRFSDSTNLLFAVPALLVGMAAIAGRLWLWRDG